MSTRMNTTGSIESELKYVRVNTMIFDVMHT